jgi:ABC-type molybdate transport system substrate-binding protein
VPNTNEPLTVTVIVAVTFILAADVLKRVPDADTVASAVICAAASTVLPANELKGAWEKLAMPNIYCSLFFCW